MSHRNTEHNLVLKIFFPVSVLTVLGRNVKEREQPTHSSSVYGSSLMLTILLMLTEYLPQLSVVWADGVPTLERRRYREVR